MNSYLRQGDNYLTQYCADRREFRYAGGRSPCRVLSSSSPPQQIPLAERPQKQERDGDDCVVADPGRPSSHAILPLLHRRRRRAAASPA